MSLHVENAAVAPRKSRGKTVLVTLCLIAIGLAVAACFFPVGHNFSAALPWSHHFSVRGPHGRGDILLAVQTVEVNGAQLRLKPGRYQVKSSGHIIDVRPETELVIDINKLVLTIPPPAAPQGDKPATPDPNARVRVEVQTADFKTTGRLMVAVDQLPAVRLNDIKVNASLSDPADVSADLFFAKIIGAMLVDVVNAPEETAEPVQRKFQPESVSITSAMLSLRPGATIKLPVGREMVLGESSQIGIRDLHYDANLGESWKARVELDIGVVPPTEFAANKLIIKPGTGRLTVALDVTLNKEQLLATLAASQAAPAKLAMAGGSFKGQPAAWEAELKNADIVIDSLQYTASPRGDHAKLNCDVTLTSTAQVQWERDGWHASANLVINGLKLAVPPAASGTKTAPQFVAAAGEQTTLQGLVLERNLGGGTIRLMLGELAVSGSVSNAMALTASLAQFKASGGQVNYQGRDGTVVSAIFAAGGSIASNASPVGQPGKSVPVELAIKGRATAADIRTRQNDKLHLQNVDIDLRAILGSNAGLSLACSGEIAVLSDRLAVAGAHASITSLELKQGNQGKLTGRVAVALSVPKKELIDTAQKELAKPIIIPGSHVGKVLDADVSLSDLHVDAHGLKLSFNGSKLHVEGPIVTTGKLITKRRIVVDVPLAGRIEKHTSNHDDFTLHARLSANAGATFPSAKDLASQAVEIHIEYQKATLELGGFLGKLPLANDAFKDMLKLFGIESKIRSALPSKMTLHLFKSAANDPRSFLARIHNPQITLVGDGDQLKLSGSAEIEY
jgi:hypothetical protein